MDRGEYGFLAMCGVGGYGYGLPMSYVADGDRIYFHCAPEGEKLDAIRENDRVSFCVVDRTRVIRASSVLLMKACICSAGLSSWVPMRNGSTPCAC